MPARFSATWRCVQSGTPGKTPAGTIHFCEPREKPQLFLRERVQQRGAGLGEFLLETPGAIAITAGPRFAAGFVPAILAIVGVLDLQQFKILLPIRPFLRQRRSAETGLDPVRVAI